MELLAVVIEGPLRLALARRRAQYRQPRSTRPAADPGAPCQQDQGRNRAAERRVLAPDGAALGRAADRARFEAAHAAATGVAR
jgi:hypothetical protein